MSVWNSTLLSNRVNPRRYLTCFLTGLIFLISCSEPIATDVFIAGGGTSGVAAGIQAARMGVSTVIAEEYDWLGGMLTSAGVSAADGNYRLRGGIWGEFTDSLVSYYGDDSRLKTGWVSNIMFEPSVGNIILSGMAAAEPGLKVLLRTRVRQVKRQGDRWLISAITEDGLVKYRSKILIDATELGDISKLCGVKYDIGMDSGYETGEEIAPEEANNIIQDLTYVAILKDYGKEVPVTKPEGYDASLFACSCINPLCEGGSEKKAAWMCDKMLNYGKLPNNKYMINWPLSGNDCYINMIEMDSGERAEAIKAAKQKTLSFLWFIRNELGYRTLALADDEFPTADSLPFIPYHRESRRIHGRVRFTLNHITAPYDQPEKLYRTCIAVGDYPVDHHHSAYSGSDSLPDLSFYPVPSFGLPMGTLIPEEVDGLIVAEKSISVTNLANGATRLQPVVMQIGQAAGAIAAHAVTEGISISEVSIRQVQNTLLDAGGYLLPYLDLPCGHEFFKILQRIGSTGIMKGTGVSQGWSNQTFFRANDLSLASELEGLKDVWPLTEYDFSDTVITVQQTVDLVRLTARQNGITVNEEGLAKALSAITDNRHGGMERPIQRLEAAILIDRALDPFNSVKVTLKGEYLIH
jgi:hypothetical protein